MQRHINWIKWNSNNSFCSFHSHNSTEMLEMVKFLWCWRESFSLLAIHFLPFKFLSHFYCTENHKSASEEFSLERINFLLVESTILADASKKTTVNFNSMLLSNYWSTFAICILIHFILSLLFSNKMREKKFATSSKITKFSLKFIGLENSYWGLQI